MKPCTLSIKFSIKSAFLNCLLPTLLMFTAGCRNSEPVELVFAFGPDDTGSIKALIDDFNTHNKGKIHVTWKEGSRLSDEFYRQIEKDFHSESPTMDVIGADVVWTAAFAHEGWAEDLSDRFYDAYEAGNFVKAALNSVSYNFKIWGIPFYPDAGILFYRKDLLEKSGFDAPPTTWKELKEMVRKIREDSGTRHGYVFQGAHYEGGVTNACEFIWNAGGRILFGDLSVSSSPDQPEEDISLITVNSQEAIEGFTDAYELVREGIAPENIYEYKELESNRAFQNGEAVFLRSWPTAYGLFMDPNSTVKTSQIGVAPLPVSREGSQSYSCLGGWNLMINSLISAEKKEAAWEFIRFMTDVPQQKFMAENAGTLPSFSSLYEDEALIQKVPAISLARNVMKNTRVRPVTPHYMEVSPDIAWAFSGMLKGELNPVEAVETIESTLTEVLAESR